MNRGDFQLLTRERRREASSLLKQGHSLGAYYLMGYAIECALKACIAKQTKKHDFPDKRLAQQPHTHDLQVLVRLAGLGPALEEKRRKSKPFELNWAIIKDWSETVRYDLNITRRQARDFYSACTARKHGVLTWIWSRW